MPEHQRSTPAHLLPLPSVHHSALAFLLGLLGPKPASCTAQQANIIKKRCLLSFITLWLFIFQIPKHRLALHLLVWYHCCLLGHPQPRRRYANQTLLTKWLTREFSHSVPPPRQRFSSAVHRSPEGTEKASPISVQGQILTGFRRNITHTGSLG